MLEQICLTESIPGMSHCQYGCQNGIHFSPFTEQTLAWHYLVMIIGMGKTLGWSNSTGK
jgi:hypothetical protein